MGYPLDQEKWRRVREMMERHDLDAGRGARTRQCPLLDELLDDEGLRPGRFSSRGRPNNSGYRAANFARRNALPGTKTVRFFLLSS